MDADPASPPPEFASAYHALVRDALSGVDCTDAVERLGRQLLWARVPMTAVRQMHERCITLLAHSAAGHEVGDHLFERLLTVYDRAMADLFDLRDELQREVRARRQDEAETLASHRAIEAANTRLQRWIEELRQFNYSLAHDLKAPLRTASSFITVYLEDNAESLGDRTPLDVATTQLIRLSRRIDDVLEHFTVLGQPEVSETVDLEVELAEVLAEMRAELDSAQARWQVDALPAIDGNRYQLRALLQNLVSNAIKYRAPERDLSLQVRVLPTPNEHTIAFAVIDNGVGIPANKQRQIFDSFTRLHSEDAVPGTGLGLTMCKLICERHGGRIDVESAPGEGSAFKVILRRAQTDALSSSTSSSSMA